MIQAVSAVAEAVPVTAEAVPVTAEAVPVMAVALILHRNEMEEKVTLTATVVTRKHCHTWYTAPPSVQYPPYTMQECLPG